MGRIVPAAQLIERLCQCFSFGFIKLTLVRDAESVFKDMHIDSI
jgi:hypothetical protein